ncbi:MAG: DUF192 domain-containing protein [bacterium]|nr:DUF192 domain-containing protein [bacterium]
MWKDKIHIGDNQFDTIVAVTDEEHATGLMYKPWPPPVMIFPYSVGDYRKFWMKNTPSPLDIIFVRAGKIVGIFKGEPMTTASVGPNEPTDMVVELPHGTAERLGISVGDSVVPCYSAGTIGRFMKRGR